MHVQLRSSSISKINRLTQTYVFFLERYRQWGNNVLPCMYVHSNQFQSIVFVVLHQWVNRLGKRVLPILKKSSYFWDKKCGLLKVSDGKCRHSVKLTRSSQRPIGPEKHIEEVHVDIIVRARFCNFQVMSRSVWRAISYQMGSIGAHENSQGKAYNFLTRVPRRYTEAKQQKDRFNCQNYAQPTPFWGWRK